MLAVDGRLGLYTSYISKLRSFAVGERHFAVGAGLLNE
jgi:hypothetical protein